MAFLQISRDFQGCVQAMMMMQLEGWICLLQVGSPNHLLNEKPRPSHMISMDDEQTSGEVGHTSATSTHPSRLPGKSVSLVCNAFCRATPFEEDTPNQIGSSLVIAVYGIKLIFERIRLLNWFHIWSASSSGY